VDLRILATHVLLEAALDNEPAAVKRRKRKREREKREREKERRKEER